MYWSSQDGLKMDLILEAMPYNKFTEIKRYINFADNSNQPYTVIDKLKSSACLRYFSSVFSCKYFNK